MSVQFMRHGMTAWNRQQRIQGRQDVPLCAEGSKQIEDWLGGEGAVCNWDVVVSSPLQRAFSSAKRIANVFHIPLRLDSAFTERGFGDIEGLCKEEWAKLTQGRHPETLEGGEFGVEPLTVLRVRLEEGLERLRIRHQRDRVLVVTHGSVIYSLGRWFEEPIHLVENVKIVEFKGALASAHLYAGR